MNRVQLMQTGEKMGRKGLIEGASGNISIKEGRKITITKKGAFLDDLNEGSLVTLDPDEDEESIEDASSDYVIHKAVYGATDFKAIIHCHGVFNVVISLVEDRISPLDFEGKLLLGDLPVIEPEPKRQESAESIAQTIQKHGVAVLRGHGIYSAGQTLQEALSSIEYVEHSCEILYRLRLLEK